MSNFSIPSILLALALFFNTSLSTDISERYVQAHKKIRAEADVPPLHWNTRAAAAARKLVEWNMEQPHEGPTLNSSMSKPYGMNVFASCTTQTMNSPEEDVEFWEGGKSTYDNVTRSCKEDDVYGRCRSCKEDDVYGRCSCYRQIVWNDTEELGCSQVVPSKEFCKNSGLGSYTVCLYYPPAE